MILFLSFRAGSRRQGYYSARGTDTTDTGGTTQSSSGDEAGARPGEGYAGRSGGGVLGKLTLFLIIFVSILTYKQKVFQFSAGCKTIVSI